MNQQEITWKSLKNNLSYFEEDIFGTFFLEIVIFFFSKFLNDFFYNV